MAASNRTTAFTKVLYAVNNINDTWFQPTVGTSDSPNYAANPDKASAVTQCALNSPEGEAILGT